MDSFEKGPRPLQAFHMRCQHHIRGIRWYDQVSNRTIREITRLGSITLDLARRCYSLFGHICRLNEHVPAHISLEFATNLYHGHRPDKSWCCPRGRQRLSWLRRCTNEFTFSTCGCWQKAEDRQLWESLHPLVGHVD